MFLENMHPYDNFLRRWWAAAAQADFVIKRQQIANPELTVFQTMSGLGGFVGEL